MNKMRAHPIVILENLTRNLLFLLIPGIKVALYVLFDNIFWKSILVNALVIDIFLFIFLTLYAFGSWYFKKIEIEGKKVTVTSGVFIKIKKEFSIKSISTVKLSRTVLSRLTGSCLFSVTTRAALFRLSKVDIKLSEKNAKQIADKLIIQNTDTLKKYYKPGFGYIAVLSAITSSSLSGILFVASFFSNTGKILGKSFENNVYTGLSELSNDLAFGLPPVAAMVAYVLILGWLIGFLLNLSRYKDFSLVRDDSFVTSEIGLFTKIKYYISVKKVSAVTIKQNLITLVLSVCSGYLYADGYGKGKNEKSVLIPAERLSRSLRILEMLIPEIALKGVCLKPKKSAVLRFINPSVILNVAIVAVGVLLKCWFPLSADLIDFMVVILLIPGAALLLISVTALFKTGLYADGDILCVAARKPLFSIVWSAVPLWAVTKIRIKRSPISRLFGNCDVLVYTRNKQEKRYVIRSVSYQKATELLKNLPEFSQR